MRALLLSSLLVAASLHADTKVLYDFEGSTQDFTGKVAVGKDGVTSGKRSLEIDATESKGWNQDLAVLAKNEDWSEATELLMDVYVPKGLAAGAGFIQLIPTFSGPKDPFFQAAKIDLHDGANPVSVKLNGKSKIGKPEKLLLIVNSANVIGGKLYVDNIRMHLPGQPGTLKVTVKDGDGKAVAGAVVAAGTAAEKTDKKGVATLTLPGDPYSGEVLGAEIEGATFKAEVKSKAVQKLTVKVRRLKLAAPVAVHAWIQAEKPGVVFDAHRIYGHNEAMWNGADPFTNPISLQKLRDAQAYMIRVPGGGYGNQWDWKTGNVIKLDGSNAVDWTPDVTWAVWKKFFADLGPQSEAILIVNLMTGTPENSVAWIKDALDSGVKVRYVELGNEPDLDPNVTAFGVKGYFTHVDNYVKQAAAHARAIRKAFPQLKLLGPCIAQFIHRECPDKAPWDCIKYGDDGQPQDDAPGNEAWMQKFLRLYSKEGDLLDGISFHSYPYWPGTPPVWDAAKAFQTTTLPAKYLTRWRGWLKQYYPAKADKMEIAMTEYHMEVPENYLTAELEAAVWHANFLAEFIKAGGTIASAWDVNTAKPGDGGGHGMLDPNNDPGRPYAERAKYWAFKMLANNFTGTMVPAQSNNSDIAVYAAKDATVGSGRTTVMVINRSPDKPAQVTLQVSGAGEVKQVRQLQLSRHEYLWSKALYRAVENVDPTAQPKVYAAPKEDKGARIWGPTVPPMSVSLFVME